jgi:hypothetical protein
MAKQHACMHTTQDNSDYCTKHAALGQWCKQTVLAPAATYLVPQTPVQVQHSEGVRMNGE